MQKNSKGYKDILDGPCHPEFCPWDYCRLRRCDSCRRAGHGGTASRCGQDSAVEDSTRASAPQLEDFLENHPREAELTVTDFRQNTPGDSTPATESTTAYLSYDDKNFYAVFVCHDEAGEVQARGLRSG